VPLIRFFNKSRTGLRPAFVVTNLTTVRGSVCQDSRWETPERFGLSHVSASLAYQRRGLGLCPANAPRASALRQLVLARQSCLCHAGRLCRDILRSPVAVRVERQHRGPMFGQGARINGDGHAGGLGCSGGPGLQLHAERRKFEVGANRLIRHATGRPCEALIVNNSNGSGDYDHQTLGQTWWRNWSGTSLRPLGPGQW